jgi:hypothetical protein
MKRVLMAREARTLARGRAQGKPGEKVRGATEPEMVGLGEALAAAAHTVGIVDRHLRTGALPAVES